MTCIFKIRSVSRKPSLTGTAAPIGMTGFLKCTQIKQITLVCASVRKDVEKRVRNNNINYENKANGLKYNPRTPENKIFSIYGIIKCVK